MKAFIAIIILFLLPLTLWGQVNDTDAFFNGRYDKSFIRKHKIKRVIVETYLNSKKSTRHLFDFDRHGFLSRQTIFDSSGEKVNGYIFTYNKRGDQSRRQNIAYRLNHTYLVTFDKTYSGSQLVKETSSELPYMTEHIYNARGQKTQSTTILGTDAALAGKRIIHYTYDRSGRLKTSEETLVSNNGAAPVPYGKTQYFYDTAGNITRVTRENGSTYQFTYNRKQMLTSRKTKLPEDLSSIEIVDNYTYAFRK